MTESEFKKQAYELIRQRLFREYGLEFLSADLELDWVNLYSDTHVLWRLGNTTLFFEGIWFPESDNVVVFSYKLTFLDTDSTSNVGDHVSKKPEAGVQMTFTDYKAEFKNPGNGLMI